LAAQWIKTGSYSETNIYITKIHDFHYLVNMEWLTTQNPDKVKEIQERTRHMNNVHGKFLPATMVPVSV
jgi:hypothetical protein